MPEVADLLAGSGMTNLDTATPSRLLAALDELQTHMPEIVKPLTATVKTSNGRDYSYNYVDLAMIYRVVKPLLHAHGLMWTDLPTLRDDGKFVLRFACTHLESGEHLGGDYPLNPSGTPQQRGSEITYARRYALCSMLGIAPEDDDGSEASERTAVKKPRAASEGALKRMFAAFNAGGIRDKDGQLNFIEEVTGTRPASRSEMTSTQVTAVVKALDAAASQPKTEDPS
ncbi:ERF family protein [Dactylosporangium sp. NPDC005572]|uniref:ERF family protein n=1 Tax=Dactylosporangium sp. NPDC005572 TaxID=3156889 RepID=UPI0033B175DA